MAQAVLSRAQAKGGGRQTGASHRIKSNCLLLRSIGLHNSLRQQGKFLCAIHNVTAKAVTYKDHHQLGGAASAATFEATNQWTFRP